MPLNVDLEVGVSGNQTNTLDLGIVTFPLRVNYKTELISGTGSGKVDLLFSDTRTINAGSSENIDLAGSLTDAFGQTITFAKVKAVVIKNKSTTQTLTVGGASSNAWQGPFGATTHTIKLQPGGVLAWWDGAGYVVTPGTGDILQIANSAGSACTYDIVIVGASA